MAGFLPRASGRAARRGKGKTGHSVSPEKRVKSVPSVSVRECASAFLVIVIVDFVAAPCLSSLSLCWRALVRRPRQVLHQSSSSSTSTSSMVVMVLLLAFGGNSWSMALLSSVWLCCT